MFEKRLATDPSAILNEAEVRLLNRELQHVIAWSLAAVPTDIIDRYFRFLAIEEWVERWCRSSAGVWPIESWLAESA